MILAWGGMRRISLALSDLLLLLALSSDNRLWRNLRNWHDQDWLCYTSDNFPRRRSLYSWCRFFFSSPENILRGTITNSRRNFCWAPEPRFETGGITTDILGWVSEATPENCFTTIDGNLDFPSFFSSNFSPKETPVTTSLASDSFSRVLFGAGSTMSELDFSFSLWPLEASFKVDLLAPDAPSFFSLLARSTSFGALADGFLGLVLPREVVSEMVLGLTSCADWLRVLRRETSAGVDLDEEPFDYGTLVFFFMDFSSLSSSTLVAFLFSNGPPNILTPFSSSKE